MSPHNSTVAAARMQHDIFATTHWSVVLAAGRQESPEAASAMETLCRTYWYPLYAYIRRRGLIVEDAQDLTQGFFAHLLSKDFLKGVRPEKGRFRTFLLVCLKNFLVDEWEKSRAAKRGGTELNRWLDLEKAEERYQLEAPIDGQAETLYERRWALDLLDRAFDQLQMEAEDSGKKLIFDRLQPCLLGEGSLETSAQMGASLGISETAVRVTLHRLRERFRELVRLQISQTVVQPDEIDAEMRYLREVVSR